MDNPVISLIVPVYNVSEYLPKCIESIMKQSFTNFELLLIDDGSTDHSGKICDQYASKYPCIKVFHQENKRLSAARNVGLDNARGEWIAFVDSDDWILKDYLKVMYAAVKEEVIDILVVQGHTKYKNGKLTDIIAFEKEKINKNELMDVFEKHNLHYYGYVSSKLYNNSVIQNHNIRFDPKVNYCEDLLFTLEYINRVSCVKFSPEANYIYLQRPNGLSNKYYTFEEEIYLSHKIRKNIISLYQEVNINTEVSAKMNAYHASWLLRAITNMYRPNTFINAKERLENLSQMPEEEISNLYHYYKKSVLGYPLLLLNNKKMKPFDLWFLTLFQLRYKFGKIWYLIQKYILKIK